ncbi:MAG: peptidase domain-containing ABC transporter [Burkholderiales bacterium]
MSATFAFQHRRHHLPLIRQSEAAECGLACLAMVASFHGHQIDLNTLRRRYPVSLSGITLRGLVQIASQLGLACRPLRLEMEDLPQLKLPAILHWEFKHFVVLRAVKKQGLAIHDPARGELLISHQEASQHITGVALELSPSVAFEAKDERAALPLSNFFSQAQGLMNPLSQVFALSVILEVLAISAPFYLQLSVDEVIARGDADLLTVLAMGFGLLMLISVATSTLRSYVLLMVQNALHYGMNARLFRHLLQLPMAWFEKRHVGDVLSRFGSLEPVRHLLAEGLIVSLIDGVMALATLIMIMVYSPLLAAVPLTALALYMLLRWGLFHTLRQRNEEAIAAKAQENSTFLETIRGLQAIKLFNREIEREGQWLNRFSEVVSSNVRVGHTRIGFQALNNLIFGLENILTVWLASRLALDNTLSIGMIFSFMAYKQHFISKTLALIERAIDLKLLGLHLERVADIALTPVEPGHDQARSLARPLTGAIELRNVSFRYSALDRFVLDNLSLRIEPGEFVTISGPSGSGKTTLIKIMLGLLEPSSGEVLIDGFSMTSLGTRAYREQVSAVMQEDVLLSGSITENICFFDHEYDQERMVRAATLAGVHEEIMAKPMGYESLVGDMGSSLSGGQKQRILLARALYRTPRILFMDEGTAHLDVDNERNINLSLRNLQITRVSIAHRPGMTAGTDRVIQLPKAA